jgi:hypothetical protein
VSFWENLYLEAWQYWNKRLADFLPIDSDWDGATPVYGVLHKSIVTPCAFMLEPAEIPQNPGYLTIFRSEDIKPDNPKEFEQVLLEVSGLKAEYIAGFNFISSFVLFPVPFAVSQETLGDVISRKFSKELQNLERHSDPDEWKLLTKSVMQEFVSDHQWLLDKIGDRILENMLLQGLYKK